MLSGEADHTVNNQCSQCGECCSDILPITEAEARKIRRYIAKHDIKPITSFTVPMRKPDLTKCPFRNDAAKRCEIYEVRPWICRDFRCDKTRKGIKAGDEALKKEFVPVSMRQTFFGD